MRERERERRERNRSNEDGFRMHLGDLLPGNWKGDGDSFSSLPHGLVPGGIVVRGRGTEKDRGGGGKI